jgi:hypothetical protein
MEEEDDDSVETIGDRELPKENYRDPDEAYEKYRDDAGKVLSDELTKLIDSYADKQGYYGGLQNRNKLIEHMIANLQYELTRFEKKVD